MSMRAVVVGLVVDELGLCTSVTLEQRGGLPELSKRYFVRAAGEYRSRQPETIFVDLEHDRVLGRVAYLERTAGVGLFAVAVIHDVTRLPVDGELFYSPATSAYINGAVGTDITLDGLALVAKPGTVSQRPVSVIPGELRDVARRPHLLGKSAALIQRAAAHKDGTTAIVDLGQTPAQAARQSIPAPSGRTEQSTRHGVGRPEVQRTRPYNGVLSVR